MRGRSGRWLSGDEMFSGVEEVRVEARCYRMEEASRRREQETVLTICIAGEDNLGSYAFNTKTKNHRFCKSCGSSILIDFLRSEQGETDPAKDIIAVNVRFTIFLPSHLPGAKNKYIWRLTSTDVENAKRRMHM